MTEVEQKVYNALKEVTRLLPQMVNTVEDTEIIRSSYTNLMSQLQKVVGARIMKESAKNG